MEKRSHHRLHLDKSVLFEEALRVLDKEFSFWGPGLKIGSDLFGLTLPMPKGGTREYFYFIFKF